LKPSVWKSAGDYHGYSTPDTLVGQFNNFDGASTAHLTLIGEYASTSPAHTYPWWGAAVGKAIFALGCEKNSNKNIGLSYAPLTMDEH